MEFDFSTEFKQGRENIEVDALSRIEPINCKTMYTHQIQGELLHRIHQS